MPSSANTWRFTSQMRPTSGCVRSRVASQGRPGAMGAETSAADEGWAAGRPEAQADTRSTNARKGWARVTAGR